VANDGQLFNILFIIKQFFADKLRITGHRLRFPSGQVLQLLLFYFTFNYLTAKYHFNEMRQYK
ncbi:MAG: hypothetical protein WAU29_02395, partial [Chitinophagaceae bacterium]